MRLTSVGLCISSSYFSLDLVPHKVLVLCLVLSDLGSFLNFPSSLRCDRVTAVTYVKAKIWFSS